MSGEQVLAELEALKIDKDKSGFIGYGQQHIWTYISGLTRLPTSIICIVICTLIKNNCVDDSY
jgi:hypothetical protein